MTSTSLTIRKLDPALKQKLRLRAAKHSRSMEEEAREILRSALSSKGGSSGDLVDRVRRRFAAAGYVTLAPPRRDPPREPPEFR